MSASSWDRPPPSTSSADATLRMINELLLGVVEKFAAHYPPGINPELDAAYGDAIDAIAVVKAAST